MKGWGNKGSPESVSSPRDWAGIWSIWVVHPQRIFSRSDCAPGACWDRTVWIRNQGCRGDLRPYNMYLTITSQCFELRSSKYCIFMHIACISDNSHHCKITVLSNKSLANLQPQITQGSPQSISYVCGTMGTGCQVSVPSFLRASTIPSCSHLLPTNARFSAVPISLPKCSRCEMGQQSQQHLKLLTTTFIQFCFCM